MLKPGNIMEELEELPDEDKASYAIGAHYDPGKGGPAVEVRTHLVPRKQKTRITCKIPFWDDNITPCQEVSFAHWDGLKKHWQKHHKDHLDKWPKKKGTKPAGYEDMEEDSGPLVAC